MALVHEVTPGLPYVVVVAPVESGTTREVIFSGSPPQPICLDEPCEQDIAVASLLVVDEDGVVIDEGLVESHAELASAGGETDDSGVGWMSTGLLEPQIVPAWRQFSGGVTHRSGRQADATLTLVPGFNEVVLRLGGYHAASEHQDRVRESPIPTTKGPSSTTRTVSTSKASRIEVGSEDVTDDRVTVY